jgi:hypothetical protein
MFLFFNPSRFFFQFSTLPGYSLHAGERQRRKGRRHRQNLLKYCNACCVSGYAAATS